MATLIRVEGGRYIIIRQNGQTERPAKNWSKLEPQARSAVRQNQPDGRHAGTYPCPARLEQAAEF